MGLGQTVGNGLLEVVEVSVIRGIQTGLLDELPQALDQIQVGRVRRQVQEFDLEMVAIAWLGTGRRMLPKMRFQRALVAPQVTLRAVKPNRLERLDAACLVRPQVAG